MSETFKDHAGAIRTRADLPSPTTSRWVISRKADVVLAIRANVITIEEACSTYGLSAEELAVWGQNYDRFGMQGMRTTRIQAYRGR